MQTAKVGKTVYFDCDDTLLEWQSCGKHEPNRVEVNNNGHTFYKKPIMGNIEALMEHSKAGHVVVVWSQGGAPWAETVVRSLQLEKYVDFVLAKPDWYYDDKPAELWLPIECQFKK